MDGPNRSRTLLQVARQCSAHASQQRSDNLDRYSKGKGKVFPNSLPSVGPGADPGVQAVSPQVT